MVIVAASDETAYGRCRLYNVLYSLRQVSYLIMLCYTPYDMNQMYSRPDNTRRVL